MRLRIYFGLPAVGRRSLQCGTGALARNPEAFRVGGNGPGVTGGCRHLWPAPMSGALGGANRKESWNLMQMIICINTGERRWVSISDHIFENPLSKLRNLLLLP